MYQRRSNLQNLMILLLDCLTIVVSLILANYIRNGRLFESDDARMDFGLLLGAVLVVFLAMNLFGSLYRNMMLRGPLHDCMCVIRNNAISFAGAAVVLYFKNSAVTSNPFLCKENRSADYKGGGFLTKDEPG